MVSEFSTFGSCSSRNIFNSNINPNYKNFFHINESRETITLISLMSNPIEFNNKLLNSETDYDNICARNDLTKDFLDFIKKDFIDYLIIDTFFDVEYNVIIIDENTYISESERFKNTELYNSFKNYNKINIRDNFNTYFQLWTKACDKFFDLINKNSKTKIILNCSRPVFKYKKDEKIIEDEKLKRLEYSIKFRDLLDSYIIKNFDVEILRFSDNILADKDHIFGFHPLHYEKKYYNQKTTQLNEIISRNKFYDYNDEINIKIRRLHQYETILNFNKNKEFENIKNKYHTLLDENNQLKTNFDFKLNLTENELKNMESKLYYQENELNKLKFKIEYASEKLARNELEIKYLKNGKLKRKFFIPMSYIYLIIKSPTKELNINFKLYKLIKNSKNFDIGYYLYNNKDILEGNWSKYFSPELHYICNGFNEGRDLNEKHPNINSKKELLEYIKNNG